jgi:transposase
MSPKEIDDQQDTANLKTMLKQLLETVKSLQETIENKDSELAELRRLLFGKKSERMPSIQSELKKRRGKKQATADKEKTQKKRAANRKAKKELPVEEIVHEVEDAKLCCPHCGGKKFKDLTDGEISYEYEFVPAQLVCKKHIRKKKACQCGEYIVTAPAPVRVSEGVQYGPGLHAFVVTSKCADSIPLYRQEKQLKRAGVPICRSTLCDMFHRSADLLEPVYKRLVELVRFSKYVRADETPLAIMDKEKTRKGYMWTFNTDEIVSYVFSPTRSGQTAIGVLAGSPGFLQVDAYSGYNQVTTPDKRKRVGCWAHVRRKFFEALEYNPELSRHALNIILKLYEVEYQAAERDVLRTDKHLAMRRVKSKKLAESFFKWIEKHKDQNPPKSRIGKAIGYASRNEESLRRFLDDPKLLLDNNMSERMLRTIALGRKNFMFVGHNDAGQNLAVLQTLISSCHINNVEPQEYLNDVLIRIQTHPQSKIDELLPHKWRPPDDVGDHANPESNV